MNKDVKVGTVLRDNDPRKGGRTVKVTAIYTDPKNDVTFAVYRLNEGGRLNKVRLDRINNGWANGWTVVPQAQAA
jgi:hypothetical protein